MTRPESLEPVSTDPIIRLEDMSFAYADEEPNLFRKLSLDIPSGVTSLMGQNGTGKSTFLLLASGRLIPTHGRVVLLGKDTRALEEDEKNRRASVVYQNMEFEAEEKLGELLEFVLANGYHSGPGNDFLKEVTGVLELDGLLGRGTQQLSKGEMQRAVIAFALLYGSQIVVMDEPVFAMEERQKRKALDFISSYALGSGRSFLFSVHELELTQKYAQFLLLFFKDGEPKLGTVAELFKPEVLEEAYQIPFALLHKKETLFRESLLKTTLSSATVESGRMI